MKKIAVTILLMCSTSFGDELQVGEAIIDASKVTYIDDYTTAIKEYNTAQYEICREIFTFCRDHRTAGLNCTGPYCTDDEREMIKFYIDDCQYDFSLCVYKTMIETWE